VVGEAGGGEAAAASGGVIQARGNSL
jgi:hypothetical protein